MIKDFYIRYGAKNSKIVMLFKYNKIKLTLYVRSVYGNKYIIVKNRDIIHETFVLDNALNRYRDEIYLLIPEPGTLFNI